MRKSGDSHNSGFGEVSGDAHTTWESIKANFRLSYTKSQKQDAKLESEVDVEGSEKDYD